MEKGGPPCNHEPNLQPKDAQIAPNNNEDKTHSASKENEQTEIIALMQVQMDLQSENIAKHETLIQSLIAQVGDWSL